MHSACFASSIAELVKNAVHLPALANLALALSFGFMQVLWQDLENFCSRLYSR